MLRPRNLQTLTIEINETVLTGNFAGESDNENRCYAKKFCDVMKKEMLNYCTEEYPDAEININFALQNASGITPCPFQVNVYNYDYSDSEIENDIKNKYERICGQIERSGEIYE